MKKLKNLDSYEKEKLERTRSQLKRIVDMIDLAIQMFEHCQKEGIVIRNRPSLDELRQPDGLAGPESDISKLEAKLENTQLSVLKKMDEQEIKQMEKDLGLKFTSEKKIRKKNTKPEQTKGYNG